MNCSVGGMNGREGSDSMNGASCENMAGWVDSQERTCEAYEEDWWLCVTAVFDADAENISAVEACCSCGGGSDYTPATLSASFFDASVVRYPSSYSYAATYETRSLTPAPGNSVGTATFFIIDISATESIDKKYAGGVLGPDGIVYFVPYDADKIGVLNPAKRTLTTIDIAATISGLKKYAGGVLGPNGIVYFVPYDADRIGVLNLMLHWMKKEDEYNYLENITTFTTIDISATISGTGKYLGGVLGPDEIVYMVPHNADKIGVLNPATQTFTTIDIAATVSGLNKYAGGVLGLDGIIYMVPFIADKIGVLNPATQTFTIMDATISGTEKYYGGVLGPDGIIYMVPFRANNIGVLNPATKTFTTIDIAWGLNKYVGGVLGPDGIVYFVPAYANKIGVLNPATQTFSTIDIAATISIPNKYWGGVLGPNNKVYMVPRNADNIMELQLGNIERAYEMAGGVPEAWRALLSPHFNKF